MDVRLKIVDPQKDQRWDEFIMAHPQGTIYHLSVWGNVLMTTYGFRPFYLVIEDKNTRQLVGIAPFMLIESWLTGKRIVSLPFTTYCNPILPKSSIKYVVDFLLKIVPSIEYIEFKLLEENAIANLNILKKRSSNITHILSLDQSLDKLFSSFHNTSVRQRIKRAKKNNLKLRMADNEKDIEKFYELETAVRKKHGLPPQPYSFFFNMWNILKDKRLLLAPLIEYEEKVVAAAMVLKFKETYYFEYSASDQQYLKFCPNQILIWEIIKIATRAGAKFFDFGRSSLSNQSLIEFKERWGGQRYSLFSCFYPEERNVNTEHGICRKTLNYVNRYLPNQLLQLEGKILYSHLS